MSGIRRVAVFCQTRIIAAHQVIRARGFELSALSALPIPSRVALRHCEESPRDRVAPSCSCEQVRCGRRGLRHQRARLASQKPLLLQLEGPTVDLSSDGSCAAQTAR